MLSTIYKVFSAIYAQDIIGLSQKSFPPGKSTTDQIFSVRQAMEKLLEYGHQLHHFFIDFKGAYDSIAKVKLYIFMREFSISAKLSKLTRLTLTNVRGRIKAAGLFSIDGNVNMKIQPANQTNKIKSLQDYNFETVDNFSNLLSKITTDNSYDDEIRTRLLAGNRTYFSFQKLLCSKRKRIVKDNDLAIPYVFLEDLGFLAGKIVIS